ncbi:MAG: rhodanese-like domain-containing protein [Muribaculaceae bacterium]|nr:rhodanese-like domain-containing protein [Muribaculaceae bacterium]MDE6792119.1 rhodanese-like domain-containing protein [Muribaculaceae bacterium]
MKKILILLLSLLGMNACMNAQGNNFTDMDVEHFAQYITNGDVQLVDVRTPEEYAEGHIEGARNIDVFDDDFLEEAQKSLDKSRPVAVYCRSGKRSADAARKLSANGFQVTNLEGGILAWKENREKN